MVDILWSLLDGFRARTELPAHFDELIVIILYAIVTDLFFEEMFCFRSMSHKNSRFCVWQCDLSQVLAVDPWQCLLLDAKEALPDSSIKQAFIIRCLTRSSPIRHGWMWYYCSLQVPLRKVLLYSGKSIPRLIRVFVSLLRRAESHPTIRCSRTTYWGRCRRNPLSWACLRRVFESRRSIVEDDRVLLASGDSVA